MKIFILWISIVQMSAIIETFAIPYNDGSHTPNTDTMSSTNRRGKRDSEVIFPDTLFVPSPGRNKPKCAGGSTFCEQIDNYPTGHVDEVLKEHAYKYEELFGADKIVEENTIITNRNNGFEEEEAETLCKSQERVIHPQAGQREDSSWLYIVNQKNYTQGVRIEECIHMNQCEMTQSFPLGYKAECRQKYIYRQLLAINENGQTVKDLFRLPSCCQCVLTRTDKNKQSIN